MRFTGTVYRAHNPKWAFDPLSGKGAKQYGGRFNRPGRPALYTSLSPETAWMEAQQGFAFKPQPLTLCGYDVDCEKVVDLRDKTTRTELKITLAELGCPWEDLADQKQTPPTWAIADLLIRRGASAILTPSFAPKAEAHDINAVFWKWGPSTPQRVEVIDDLDRLPRNDSSWR